MEGACIKHSHPGDLGRVGLPSHCRLVESKRTCFRVRNRLNPRLLSVIVSGKHLAMVRGNFHIYECFLEEQKTCLQRVWKLFCNIFRLSS